MTHTLLNRPSPPGMPAATSDRTPALLVACGSVVVLVATYIVLVLTPTGQRFDEAARLHLAASTAPRHTLSDVLQEVTAGSIIAVLAACVVVAIARRRWAAAVGALVLVAGANITTQLLKHVILERPQFGYETTNSMPSGHTTVVTSLVLAALLVAPAAWRFAVSLIGATLLAVTGVGTIVANWHRPSDVIAAFAVALVWGSLVLVGLAGHARVANETPRQPRSHPLALMVGLALSAGLFLAVGVRPNGAERDLVAHVVTMCGLAVAGALVVGVYARLVNRQLG